MIFISVVATRTSLGAKVNTNLERLTRGDHVLAAECGHVGDVRSKCPVDTSGQV